MDLEVLQLQHRIWVDHNFPRIAADREMLARHGLFGMTEEVGELAHCFIKHEQGIRGLADREVFLIKAADAIGDAIIYADTVCMGLGLNFPAVVKETWSDVRRRDWIKFPKDGLTE